VLACDLPRLYPSLFGSAKNILINSWAGCAHKKMTGENFTRAACVSCGRDCLASPNSKNPRCKRPDADFRLTLTALSEDRLKTALLDKEFAAQYARLQCWNARRDFRLKIKESVPEIREVSEDEARNEGRQEDVETSEGSDQVDVTEINEGMVIDPERRHAPKATDSKKSERKNRDPKAPRIKNTLNKPHDERRQPSYMKSVSYPLIPTGNPQAPFGYDDNDRPIGVPVGRPPQPPPEHRGSTYSPICTGDEHVGTCDECKEQRLQAKAHAHNDECERAAQPTPLSEGEKQERERAAMLSHAQKFFFSDGGKIRPTPLPSQSWRASTPQQEKELREAQRRQEQQQEKELLKQLKAAGNIKDKPFVCLREVLGLTREQVISWFPFVLSPRLLPEPVPEPPPIDVKGHTEAITKLRAKIEELEKEFAGMSAKAIVGDGLAPRGKKLLKDGSPNPSYLDTATRNYYKRQFKTEITKLDKEIREHENAKRRKPLVVPSPAVEAIPSRDLYTIEQMPHHTRVSTINRVVRERDFTLEDFLALFLVVRDEEGRRCTWAHHYQSIAALQNPPIPDDDYENKAIQLAIQVGACPQPSEEIRSRYPEAMDSAFAKFFGWGDVSEADTASENKLITKTGGAQIGGQIASAGLLWNPGSGTFRQRALHTFDLPERSGGSGSSGGTGEHDAGESDAYENPEDYTPD
jgi:hypothetical protein